MNRVSTCSGGAGPTTFSTPAPFSLFTCATKGGWGYARVHQAGWAVEWKLLMTRELREVECQIWRRRKVVIGWMSMISIRRARNQKQPVAFATSCRSIVLRRERDSNSRYPFGVHTLSRRASSATRASLQYVSTRFPGVPLQPLEHLSNTYPGPFGQNRTAKVIIFSGSASTGGSIFPRGAIKSGCGRCNRGILRGNG